MFDFFSSFPGQTDLPVLLLAAGALVFAYTVFHLVGFGSALIAGAPLAAVMPVARVVPLLALLDCASAASRGWRARRQVSKAQLARLVPGMLLGQLLGVVLLARLPLPTMAMLLGGFVTAYGISGLSGKRHNAAPTGSALLHGLAGGALGGLFGSGGFIYASYLARRLENRDAFRATQAVLIALSTAWRLCLCLAAGLIDTRLLMTALMLLPALFAGTALGKRIDFRLSREHMFLLLNMLLIVCGLSLIARVLL